MAEEAGKGATTNPALSETMAAGSAGVAAGLLPGWLGKRYSVKRLLGRGGMGAVYLAVDEALVCDVALKLIAPQLARPGQGLEQLRDEVRLAQKVTHPNVCRTFDLEELEGNWLVKMEFVAGETLASRLERGPLPIAEAIAVTTQICAGLAAAHLKGVVHRDLKPHNIMLEAKTGRVVLMDFGIARAAALAGKTAENVSGTPEYMAPEQARGREVDGRADLYSLGCVLYEMLVGEKVFSRSTPMATALAHAEDPPPVLPATLPERLRRLVAQLLDKDPEARPSHADEVAAALVGPRRRRWPLVVIALLAVAAVAIAMVELRPAHRWQPDVRQLAVYDEESDTPAFSPDSQLIAYASDRESPGSSRIYVESLDGGSPRAVTPPHVGGDNPRWTHDGKALLFSDGKRAFRVPLAGGPPEVLAEPAIAVEDCAGRLLIVYGGAPGCPSCKRLAVRDADGQERDLVRFSAVTSVSSLRCDREGRRALYALSEIRNTIDFGPSDLWMIAIDGGSPRRLTTDHAANMGGFTPDGRSIVYSATHDERSGLWEMSADGNGPPVRLTQGQGWEYLPDVSADGRLVVYDVDLSSMLLFEQPLAGGPVRRVTSASLFLDAVVATPDGRAIIAQAHSSISRMQIMSIPLDGSAPVSLVDGETPALTLDGQEVLYSLRGRMMAIPLHGGAPRSVTEVDGVVMGVRAAPDGKVHMMVARPQGFEAWSAPLAGGSAERELPEPWVALYPAPRGGWRAAYQSGTDGWRVRFLAPGAPLEDPAAREITVEVTGRWATNGLSFLYRRGATLRRFDVETGEDRTVTERLETPVISFAISADGNTLYTIHYVGRTRREVITNFADRPRL